MNKSSVIGKILITGDLVLASPLLIGDGEGETNKNFIDMHVLKNHDNKPFIPGTSLCGVLREWLTKFDSDAVTKIFGDMDEMQSSIQIEDIVLAGGEIFSRDGVRIDELTGTGVTGGKYDFEFVERGASGKLRLLINLRGIHADGKKTSPEIVSVIKTLLKKLSDGIRLGALTSKGFGLAKVKNLNANIYDFREKADVAAWLLDKDSSDKISPSTEDFSAPKDFVVNARFKFNSSFIVRDYEVNADDRKKKVSSTTLKSRGDFVIPGTTLKGILRHRAEYIFGKLGLDKNLLDDLMGTTTNKSRFIVAESYVETKNFAEVNHTRNKIDRFTGGTLQGTLFTTKPAYQKNFDAPTLEINFEIHDAKTSEAGLAIFLLRDLWFGRVAIGGEKSIGRGTLKGLSAEIKFRGETYTLDANGKILNGDKNNLENFAAALKNFAGGDGK
ncbi:MAG: CRISPR-associated protein [Selenomonadaceae bacterium]|nr:CRISPR-associated protein [Selenomonadaceae bacterium]